MTQSWYDFSSSYVSFSESYPGTLSACVEEVSSERLCLRSSSVSRAVVRVFIAFMFRSVSGAENFVGGVIGSTAANAAAAAEISTLHTRQTGAQPKG